MLADPRSDSLVKNFAGQWLYLRNLPTTAPLQTNYPDWDDNLRQGLRTETEKFFESIVREDRNVLDLLTADYTFVNERVAKHYGIPNVYGSQFRRVTVSDEARRGLLGQGSVLTVTSFATRTSPVLRGKWILKNIFGTPPPEPPPNVPELQETNRVGEARGEAPSVRARFEEHRTKEPCRSCHKMMDPLGFSLENFDAVGKWRTIDGGMPVDPSGELFDGSKISGPVELRKILLQYSPQFAQTVSERLLTYALGRAVEYYDMPAVRAITREAGGDNYRFSSIVLGIVRSMPFQMKASSPDSKTAVVGRE